MQSVPGTNAYSFVYPFPKPECVLAACDPLNPELFARTKDYNANYSFEVGLVKDCDGHPVASEFRLTASAPIPDTLGSALAAASERLIEIWARG